ncbi:uncharacterized protein LOC117122224 [Anneissia japonica]|uniref:uncharacterized protein LOC117122224 n=1 Tax=Anneissia japonica TaxID=1529436 RepID=UPI0014256B39|nr:uncharacterized protein LOC117122224 [Anneissia japonica]XP_033123626.1 uncharacterized protein LOC117122224 [Anneissia japonica]
MAGRCDDYSDSSIRSDFSDGEGESNMYCVMHVTDTVHRKIKVLKAKHLKRFMECAPIWKTLKGTRESVVADEADKIFLHLSGLVGLGPTLDKKKVDNNGSYESGAEMDTDALAAENSVENGRKEGRIPGFHERCYRCFCNISSIEKKIKRLKKYEGADDPERNSLLNSLLAKKRCLSSTSDQVIQSGCVICKGDLFIKNNITGKKFQERLVSCEKLGFEILVEAAILKQDKVLLKTLRGGNSDVVKEKCHKLCHLRYTKIVKASKKVSKVTSQQEHLYVAAYIHFCKKFIEERIIRKKEILRLGELNKSFIKEVSDMEGKDASCHTTSQLKDRLRISYPVLCFSQPTEIVRSEFVYTETLSTEEVMDNNDEELDGTKNYSDGQSPVIPTQDQNPFAIVDQKQELLLVPLNECVLCRRRRSETDRRTGVQRLEKLGACVKGGAEKIVKAAILRQDEVVLKILGDKRSTDFQVKCHRTCYKRYTNILSRGCKNKDPVEQQQLYVVSYTNFCRKFIEERIIKKKEILRLSEMNKSFIKEVSDVEGKDASALTTAQLKARMIMSYPVLCFIQPSKIIKTEFVFTECLSLENFVKKNVEIATKQDTEQSSSSIQTPSKARDDMEDRFEDADGSDDSMNQPLSTTILDQESPCSLPVDMYHAALGLRAIMDIPTNPDVMTFDDETVPARLFNFLAWITNLSEDQPERGTVNLPEHFKISVFSLAQDIMYLKSRSKSLKS